MILRLLLQNPIEFFGWFLAFLIAIMSHEVAHGYAASINGDNTARYAGRLNFNPLKHFDLFGALMFLVIGFGYAKPVPIDSRNFRNYKKGCIMVSIAGVLTNLILAFVATPLLILATLYLPDLLLFDDLIKYFLSYMVHVNVMLMVFNLLPIYPLDGFRLVEIFAPYSNYAKFMYKYSRIVMLVVIALIYLADIVNLPFLNIVGFISNFVKIGLLSFWGLIL